MKEALGGTIYDDMKNYNMNVPDVQKLILTYNGGSINGYNININQEKLTEASEEIYQKYSEIIEKTCEDSENIDNKKVLYDLIQEGNFYLSNIDKLKYISDLSFIWFIANIGIDVNLEDCFSIDQVYELKMRRDKELYKLQKLEEDGFIQFTNSIINLENNSLTLARIYQYIEQLQERKRLAQKTKKRSF